MTPEKLRCVNQAFARFTQCFVTGTDVPADMSQKIGHSRRVAALCREFAESLNWAAEDLVAVQAMGLVHDVGRFEQLSRHGTFNDAASVDHGVLGTTIVHREDLLCGSDGEEADAILFAVQHHNGRSLPAAPDGRLMAYLKLLRDADKVDIMHTFGETIRRGDLSLYPQVFADRDTVLPPDPGLIREVRNRETGSYDRIGSVSDIVLVGLSWVHDTNFLPALRCIRDRGLLEGFEAILGGSAEALAVLEQVRTELAERLDAHAGR